MADSREQDAAQAIKRAQINVEKAQRAYSKGSGVDQLNTANRKLADAHDTLHTIDSGLCNYD
ncbi:hypothetical protein [Bradyrhizobium sp. WSM471]|uniref:hypothetical protein n=1 Tax=Bradyrhizobium sp. WSM471 TaxID=319017 RepID=UPI00024D2D9C|nr:MULTISPECIES: hypothetical protein [Bradyrhizobium]EHR03227.1 hypothetical protein Bra471DRAFT_03996 [Bradyrhizobium sp. WSM471]UFW38455.1 hypothetical protein BcanWSM471_19610 [Bradyrhizobium canariense]